MMQSSAHVRPSRRQHSNELLQQQEEEKHHDDNDADDNKYQKEAKKREREKANNKRVREEQQQRRRRRRRIISRREKELVHERQLAIVSSILCIIILFSLVVLYYVWWTKSSLSNFVGRGGPQRRRRIHPPDPTTMEETIKRFDDQWLQMKLKELDTVILNDGISKLDILLNPKLFPPLPITTTITNGTITNPLLEKSTKKTMTTMTGSEDTTTTTLLYPTHGPFFRVSRLFDTMPWQKKTTTKEDYYKQQQLKVDYTKESLYEYPSLPTNSTTTSQQQQLHDAEATTFVGGGYPKLTLLSDVLTNWPPNEIDRPLSKKKIQETLHHLDYTQPQQLQQAWMYIHQQQQLPFKLTNVPEILNANIKWTDEYLIQQFDNDLKKDTTSGHCQESPTNFFPFYDKRYWRVEIMGLPPTRINDFSFQTCWSHHAQYADMIQLSSNRPHFYWQAGILPQERHLRNQSFISRDLPSFSSTEPTLLCPNPDESKGIQCRFGERGITAAMHYDGGQNMVAMITGAKRYILSPPNQCFQLGIETTKKTALYRHSLLNLERMTTIIMADDNTNNTNNTNHSETSSSSSTMMSKEEKEWLNRASKALVVETVLKAGEVLFIPSHWFHYIIGLQKNAQCNVRSGVHIKETTKQFGGQYDISPKGCRP